VADSAWQLGMNCGVRGDFWSTVFVEGMATSVIRDFALMGNYVISYNLIQQPPLCSFPCTEKTMRCVRSVLQPRVRSAP
jgi:hypothetical protein